MADYLLKAISKSGTVRVFAAITTDTVNSAFKIQNPATLSGIILGNVLTVAALCGATLKGNGERIAVSFCGNGKVGKAMAEATADGKIRGGIANPKIEFSADEDARAQINNAIGVASMLTVTKDLGLKQPYSGTINCMTGDIGSDIAYYFTQSEQIPSAVAVSTIHNYDGVEISGGYLVQQIPQDGGFGAQSEEELSQIVQTINSGVSVNSMLLNGFSPEKMLESLFTGVKFEVLDKVDLSFECSCNRENIFSALNMLDDATKAEILENNENIEIICELCKKKYYITLGKCLNFLEKCI
jgi:molecular chaperone Hsp33